MEQKFPVICGILAVLAVCLIVIYIQEYRRHQRVRQRLERELARNREQLQRTEEIYESFLPERLARLAGCRSAQELSPDRQRAFFSTVMSVGDSPFAMTPEKPSALSCRGLSCLLPVAMESGGVVNRLESAEMTVLYPEDAPGALAAAIRMCEAADSGKAEPGGDVAIGLDYGTVRLGIAGCAKRLSVITWPESVKAAGFLQAKAVKYGTRILATDRFAGQIADFEKRCSSRLLGYFYEDTRQELVKIYDIYDGDPVERRQAKRKTRMIFEQGVDRFVYGLYEEARLCFVEVLKADRQDLAAREYLYRCDRLCRDAEAEKEIGIETF